MLQSILLHRDDDDEEQFKVSMEKDAAKQANEIIDLFDAPDDVTISNLKSVS